LQDAIQQERDTFLALISAMDDEVWFLDANLKVTLLNDTAPKGSVYESVANMDFGELYKKLEVRRPDGTLFPIEESPTLRALHGEKIKNVEQVLETPSTGELWHREVSAAPLTDSAGKMFGVLTVVHDITRRKKNEEHIRKLNRLYAVLSGISETIVRVKDSNAMLEAACRIAVNEGHFRMAWIGLINPNTHVIEPVASCGEVDGYLDQMRIDISDPSYATGPGVRSISSEIGAVCNDIEHDPLYVNWRDGALRRGYRSSAGIALRVNDQVVGVFGLYSSEPGFFEGDEHSLLEKMASNISFALEVNLLEEERRKATENVRKLNRLYTVLSEINQTIVREKDSQAMLEAACRIAADQGKFPLAWIGAIDPASPQINRVAWCGDADGYLDRIKIDLLDPNCASGPVAQCVRSEEHAICNDLEHELISPWKNKALEKGFRSAAVFPLRCEKKLAGVFCLYARELGFFDEAETRLLDGLAADISFALTVRRHEEKRNKAEVQLYSKTALLEAQINSTIDAILVVDSSDRRILQNRRLFEIFKFPIELQMNSEGETAREHILSQVKYPEAVTASNKYLTAHPLEKSRDELELKDGTILDRYSSPVVGEDGKYYGRIWTHRDITDRKRAEIELKSKTALLEAQINSTNDGILVVDPSGQMVLQNRRFFEIFKIPLELQALGDDRPAAENSSGLLKDPEAFLARIDYLNAHLMERCSEEIEFKDGSTFDRYSAPVVDDAGKYYGRIWTFRDITERKRDEDRLRQLSLAVEQSPAVVVITDPRGNITYVNRKFTECTGYTGDEVQGKNPRILNSGHSSPESYKMMWETITRGHEWRGEFRNRKKSGEVYWEAATITPILNKAGEATHFVALKEDVTERRVMEAQLRQSQKMDAIGQLTGGIAHDFNNLLAVIVGNLDLLERQIKGNEPAVKRVHTARNASLRGAELTHRLLAFSRQEVLQPKAVDLNAVIETVLALATPALGPEVQVITRLDPSVPTVFVDASGLENALLNLVVNARDAMAKGGKLTITSELRNLEAGPPSATEIELKPGGYAYVAVSDTGHGMTKEIAEKAFEPFFTTKPHGTGLGLAMVYGFFKQSGGTVHIYSEPGSGTTLSFFLPLDESEVRLPSVPALEAHSPDAADGVILIVDDEAELLEIASTCLSGLGYTVLTAKDGASARHLLEERDDIALLLTDIIMPGGMTGVELAEWALKIRPFIRIIYCSGFPAEALRERNMSLAEDSLLRKPYQRSELISIVGKTLEPVS
jgi:PAS domain S-box-containing protein